MHQNYYSSKQHVCFRFCWKKYNAFILKPKTKLNIVFLYFCFWMDLIGRWALFQHLVKIDFRNLMLWGESINSFKKSQKWSKYIQRHPNRHCPWNEMKKLNRLCRCMEVNRIMKLRSIYDSSRVWPIWAL